MAIPTTIAPVKTQDFRLTPIYVNKHFSFSQNEFATTSSGYTLVEGLHSNLITPIGAKEAQNDSINNTDGSFKHVIWKSIDHLYYRYENPLYYNPKYIHRNLNVSASWLAMPYMDYGLRIKKNSVEITSGSITIIDDGNGNLIDKNINEKYYPQSHIAGYWGFNDAFRLFKYQNGYKDNVTLPFKSSFINNNTSVYNKITFKEGINNTGMAAGFGNELKGDYNNNSGSSGYIRTDHSYVMNLEGEFSISFWIYPNSDNHKKSVINKRGVTKDYKDETNPVFPYDFQLEENDNKLYLSYTRSDGLNYFGHKVEIPYHQWTHITLVRWYNVNEFKMSYFKNEQLIDTQDDITDRSTNKNCVMFGSLNQKGDMAFNGFLDEIVFNKKVMYKNGTLDFNFYEFTDLYPNIIGNIFYRTGDIIISPYNTKYKDLLKNNFNIKFQSTHIIYQYEILCRIKKGAFNISTNPSARINGDSDILIDLFSKDEVLPYATTVGLYNDSGVLIAVAKLAQPLQMQDSVDLNILIKFDA